MRCTNCETKTEKVNADFGPNIAGHAFLGQVTGFRCPKCHKLYYDGPAVGRFELAVALELGRRGMISGPAFKFMRKTLGMRATDLTRMLWVADETISWWETGERDVDRPA